MCYLDKPTVSKFRTPLSIGTASVTAIDIITNDTLVIEFRTSAPLCLGEDEDDERHFYLRQAQYQPMVDAIAANKMILIKGVESPTGTFTKVNWGFEA